MVRRRNSGFSYIEILFSVFLVSLCGAVIIAAMPTSTRGRTKASFQNRATAIAQRQMESIRTLGYPNITVAGLLANGLIDSNNAVQPDTFSFTNVDTLAGDGVDDVLPSGVGTVRIDNADTELRRIVVTVSWVEGGATRTYQIGSLVANL